MRRLNMIGVASGLGANIDGSEHGPSVLARSERFLQQLHAYGIDPDWSMIRPEAGPDRFQVMHRLFSEIALYTRDAVSSASPFVSIGGDHSMAMGVWQGVMSALKTNSLGMIWIDAHLDLHTMESSVSCNIHGMPLAALLGVGDDLLQQIYGSERFLDPANVVLVGGHSYEPQEIDLARRLALAVYDMDAIKKSGSLTRVIRHAMGLVADSSDRFGVSIDLDVLDPRDAPGVNTPEQGGIRWRDLQETITLLRKDSRLLGLEIAEFNPARDRGGRTQEVIAGLIGAFYGEHNGEN
jgi:arginase